MDSTVSVLTLYRWSVYAKKVAPAVQHIFYEVSET